MMTGTEFAVAKLLCKALDALETRPHAYTVPELVALVGLAQAFRMPIAAAQLVNRLRVAQSSLSG